MSPARITDKHANNNVNFFIAPHGVGHNQFHCPEQRVIREIREEKIKSSGACES